MAYRDGREKERGMERVGAMERGMVQENTGREVGRVRERERGSEGEGARDRERGEGGGRVRERAWVW